MSPDNARRAANGILIAAGVTLTLIAWRQPRLRRALWELTPTALKQVRLIHVAAAIAALANVSESGAPARRPPRP